MPDSDAPAPTSEWPDRYIEALRAFALRNKNHKSGYSWRECLWEAWCNHTYWKYGCSSDEASRLQALRNDPGYGPGTDFIENFKP